MIITAITDEITTSFIKSLEIGIKYDIRHYEIRSIDGFRFPFFPDCYYEILDRYKKEYGLAYTSVSPGLFKNNIELAYEKGYKRKIWNQILSSATKLDVKKVLIFSYDKCESEREYNMMIEEMRAFAAIASDEGISVNLENSPSTFCVTGRDLLKIIKDVDSKNLRANWDPANAGIRGYLDYKDGYDKIKRYIDNVHIKDVIGADIPGKYTYAPCGEGLMDLKSQIEDLKCDGYDGPIVLETHCKPLLESFIKSYAFLKQYI